MEAAESDALVFFGASGDLAFKQIFPALLGLVADEGVNVPIVGVAKAGWTVEQLRARAKDSIQQHGRGDDPGLAKLLGLLRYVDGDYNDPRTFADLKRRLAAPSGRCTISRFRRACLASSFPRWPRPVLTSMRVSSSRSHSAAIRSRLRR